MSDTAATILYFAIILTPISIFIIKRVLRKKQYNDERKILLQLTISKDLSEFYITRGFAPSKEELNRIADILSNCVLKNMPKERVFEKIISFIPSTTPSLVDFKAFVYTNLLRLSTRFIPNQYFDRVNMEAFSYCDITEEELYDMFAIQKAEISPEEMSLYRFNYEHCAYAILYNTILNIEPISDDFTEEVRKDILQKILAGAAEEGYNLKDDYKNNY